MIVIVLILYLTINQNLIKCINFETNKVIIHRPVYSKNTNFGYSVAGYKVDNDSWILIGAPLTVRDRYHGQVIKSREGAVYRCRINVPNSCFMLPFDKKDWNEARDHYGIYYSENKTDQLLGATLLVSDDVIMTCAPNYRYVTRMLRQDEFRYEPTGTCFTLRDKMRKFEEHSPCRNAMWGHHRQGYCQAGFAGAISKNDSSLFITGPGAWYWQGMIFSINLFNKDIRNRYPDKSGEGNNDDSYRGYSIDIGHFDNDIYEDIAVSSPRGNNCKGYVEIFSSNFKLLHTLHGSQIGAYFGASIISLDLNNDRSNDLVIGSPMYKKDTENYDIGRIDIFIRDKRSKGFGFKQITLNGFKSRSRFGTTLAKLGDVNDDGFNDIAVAAPYDGDDLSGIVYIFHGNYDGIDLVPSQIIKGSDYGLKTFGFSLSGGLDLDGNKYPDLIVGAHKSDAVAYIRSKSVIKTTITTQTNPKVIDFDSKDSYCDKNKTRICIDFEYCIEYYGKSVPQTIRMLITLELDTDKYQNKSIIRGMFSETKSHLFSQNFTFKSEQKKCFKQLIYIKKALRDKLTPIKCRVNLTLPNYDTDWELLPMFNSKEDSSKTHEMRFLRNCGSDDICTPNLQVTASTPTKKYIYGSQYNIDLNIQVENSKEDAFESQCHITLPYGVDYVKAFVSQNSLSQQLSLPCYQNKISNTTKIICDIGNPMIGGSSKSFTIRVAPQNLLFDQEILKFNITVTSSNKEDKMTMFDNEHYVYVVLDAIPGIALIGKQYQEQVIYETKSNSLNSDSRNNYIENELDIGPEIMHEYKVINKGPSQFLLSELLIAWQKEIKIGYKNKNFLYLMEMPYTEGPIKCSIDNLEINPLNISKISEDRIKNPEKYYIESKEMSNKVKRSFMTKSDDTSSSSSSSIFSYLPTEFYLNPYKSKNFYQQVETVECSAGMIKQKQHETDFDNNLNMNLNNNEQTKLNYLNMMKSDSYGFYCSSIHCKVGPLNADESALIRLRFRLWSKSLAANPEIYHIKTSAMSVVTEIPYSKVNLNLDQFQNSVQIETLAHPRERKQLFQHIDIRIIILSVIAGVILLILLIILLWCCGFFKRFEPHEDSKNKLSELATSDEEISSSNDVIDVSKELAKSENENRENINLLSTVSPNLSFKMSQFQQQQQHQQTQMFNTSLSITNKQKQPLISVDSYQENVKSIKNNNKSSTGKNSIYTNPKTESKNTKNSITKSDEIYGFIPLNQSNRIQEGNQLSTFQNMIHNSSKTNTNHFLSSKLITNNSPNKYSNASPVLPFYNQETTNSNKQLKPNSTKPDSYTNKLPPVPRRNSKTNLINNSNGNLTNLPITSMNQKSAIINANKTSTSSTNSLLSTPNKSISTNTILTSSTPSLKRNNPNSYQKM